jgi:hypothetical protein
MILIKFFWFWFKENINFNSSKNFILLIYKGVKMKIYINSKQLNKKKIIKKANKKNKNNSFLIYVIRIK